jgi:hypothetical protein
MMTGYYINESFQSHDDKQAAPGRDVPVWQTWKAREDWACCASPAVNTGTN